MYTLNSHVLNSSDSNQNAIAQPTLLSPLTCSHPRPWSVFRAQIFLFFLQSEIFFVLFILKTIYKGNNNILWLLASLAPGVIYTSLWEQHTPCHVLLI